MKWTGLNELREKFLSYYEKQGHLRHKSFSLIPEGDKSLLLINAGMAPLKKYFTGEVTPPKKRMTTCQKCIRTPDIDRVGITARHGTFFEMLGNFSFGDYFKREAINWAWNFCLNELELPRDRLWVTIYQDDDEAFEIWNKEAGVPEDRIVRLGKEDNFWEIGSGPCGPCSEIHFDRGEQFGCGKPDCKPGCDCDRFMEFWNLVFTQFDGDGKGNYTPLAHPNIDTGMGLERIACLMQGVNNLFEVDTVANIIAAAGKKAGIKYGEDDKKDISLRIIADHARGTSFLIADGVVPSNEGRGYVLRRLLRRAARHGRLIGITEPFMADMVSAVAKENESAYPELTEKLDYIRKIVDTEEKRFNETIDAGTDKLNGYIEKAISDGSMKLKGEDIFRLSDTYGFSIDLTREIAAEKNIALDEEGFEALMQEQKQRARDARSALGDFSWEGENYDFVKGMDKTEFTGYDETESEGVIKAIFSADSTEETEEASDGRFLVILDKTPFYGEGGGQVGDTGTIRTETACAEVIDTKKHDGVYIHVCKINSGAFFKGDKVTAAVDAERRNAIKRSHSAAHLLQAALREVLGNHVEQSGSYVDENITRFDFTHFAGLTAEEIAKVEEIVNKAVLDSLPVSTVETDIESAKKAGATALFSDKYGDTVRMVKMGDFSTELCGGTHVSNTSELGLFKILSEASVSAGVRRIEAVTGKNVLRLIADKDALIHKTAEVLKSANPHDIAARAAAVTDELKEAKREIEKLTSKLASGKQDNVLESATDIGGVKFICGRVDGITVDAGRKMCDSFKEKFNCVVTVLAVGTADKMNIIASADKDATAKGAHCGNLVREISALCDGRGGGKDAQATAGVGDVSKVDAALSKAAEIFSGMVK